MEYVAIIFTIIVITIIVLPIRSILNRINNNQIRSIFENQINDLIAYYLENKGVYDSMIDATDINRDDYKQVIKVCVEFVNENLDTYIKNDAIKYLGAETFSKIILRAVDKELGKIYLNMLNKRGD